MTSGLFLESIFTYWKLLKWVIFKWIFIDISGCMHQSSKHTYIWWYNFTLVKDFVVGSPLVPNMIKPGPASKMPYDYLSFVALKKTPLLYPMTFSGNCSTDFYLRTLSLCSLTCYWQEFLLSKSPQTWFPAKWIFLEQKQFHFSPEISFTEFFIFHFSDNIF